MTTHTELHPLAQDYLRRLYDAARTLEPDQATELVSDISDHLREALAPGADEATVRTVLDRLGSPHELVEAAGGTYDTSPSAPTAERSRGLGAVELLALMSLVAAELLFFTGLLAILAWVAGIALIVVSKRWSDREKTFGFLGLVLGYPVVFTALMVPAPSGTTTCSSSVVTSSTDGRSTAGEPTCVTEGGWPDWAFTVVQVVFVAYLCFQVWTIWRLTRRR